MIRLMNFHHRDTEGTEKIIFPQMSQMFAEKNNFDLRFT